MISALRERWSLIFTFGLCLALYLAIGFSLDGFLNLGIFVNFFGDNAYLGLAAIGMTFVILTGGIDLSVGAVSATAGILLASLVEERRVSVPVSITALLAAGVLFGAGQGWLITKFKIPPFLATLAGLFLCRGIGLALSSAPIGLTDPWIDGLKTLKIPLGDNIEVPFQAWLLVLVVVVFGLVLRYARFGRTVYALGSSEQNANLMGLATSRTKIGVYALSGACAVGCGILNTLYTGSGDAIGQVGLELDAITAVVIGGTLLTGGYGSVFGTLIGLLTYAIIQSAIRFDGTLSTWWAKIATGALLLVFILLQRFMHRREA